MMTRTVASQKEIGERLLSPRFLAERFPCPDPTTRCVQVLVQARATPGVAGWRGGMARLPGPPPSPSPLTVRSETTFNNLNSTRLPLESMTRTRS